MNDWLREVLAQTEIKPLLADIQSGRVKSSAVLLAIQQLTDYERREMKPALDLVIDALSSVEDS